MSVKITHYTQQIRNDIRQKASIFLRLMSEDIVKESTPNTPKKTNRLRLDTLRQVLGLSGKVIWTKKYAAIQENKQHKNYTTPGTGPHYALNAVKKSITKTSSIAKTAGFIK